MITLKEQGATPELRQTILLSATLGPGVERLAGLALREEREFIDASSEELSEAPAETMSVPESLEQWVLAIPAKLRLVALAAFIAEKCEVNKYNILLLN